MVVEADPALVLAPLENCGSGWEIDFAFARVVIAEKKRRAAGMSILSGQSVVRTSMSPMFSITPSKIRPVAISARAGSMSDTPSMVATKDLERWPAAWPIQCSRLSAWRRRLIGIACPGLPSCGRLTRRVLHGSDLPERVWRPSTWHSVGWRLMVHVVSGDLGITREIVCQGEAGSPDPGLDNRGFRFRPLASLAGNASLADS